MHAVAFIVCLYCLCPCPFSLPLFYPLAASPVAVCYGRALLYCGLMNFVAGINKKQTAAIICLVLAFVNIYCGVLPFQSNVRQLKLN